MEAHNINFFISIGMMIIIIRKQEVHGPHRSPEKLVQINEYIWAIYEYIYYGLAVQGEQIFKFREYTFAFLLSPNVSPLQGWFVLSLFEIGPVVLEKKIFKFVNVFLQFCNYFPLGIGCAGPFIWTNLNPLHPRMFCAMFGWNLRSFRSLLKDLTKPNTKVKSGDLCSMHDRNVTVFWLALYMYSRDRKGFR